MYQQSPPRGSNNNNKNDDKNDDKNDNINLKKKSMVLILKQRVSGSCQRNRITTLYYNCNYHRGQEKKRKTQQQQRQQQTTMTTKRTSEPVPSPLCSSFVEEDRSMLSRDSPVLLGPCEELRFISCSCTVFAFFFFLVDRCTEPTASKAKSKTRTIDWATKNKSAVDRQ